MVRDDIPKEDWLAWICVGLLVSPIPIGVALFFYTNKSFWLIGCLFLVFFLG